MFCAAALRRSDGNYVINGNWAINWSGEYEAVGTRFTYRRQEANHGELIEAPGPLLEPVDLMVGTISLLLTIQFIRRTRSSSSLPCAHWIRYEYIANMGSLSPKAVLQDILPINFTFY